MSELLVNTIKKADGTGSLTVPAESGTVVTTASPSLGRRNLIINGAMQVWQRGTSQSSNGFGSVDRWSMYAASGMSVSRSTDVPDGFKYSCSFGGTGDSSGLTTRLEGKDCTHLAGQTVTISFYLKQTTGAGTGAITVALLHADAEDNFGGTTYINQTSIDTTTSWARYTVTVTNLSANSVNGLALNIKSASTGSVVYLVTGVQLEVGSVASSYEHRSYGEELALCQRYYYSLVDGDGKTIGLGNTHGSTTAYIPLTFPVTMRSEPTLLYNNTSNYYYFAYVGSAAYVNSLSAGYASTNTAIITGTINTSLTIGEARLLRTANASAYIHFDAEL